MCVWRVSFYNNKSSISRSGRVSSVINHVLRSQPHQGLSTQETGTLERYHTPKGPAPRGARGGAAGAGVQASFAPERMHARTHARRHARPWAFSGAARCSVAEAGTEREECE